MYNYIIKNEGFVKIKEIEKRDVVFCGTSNESENCLKNVILLVADSESFDR
jgi:hypothetical protein